MQHNLAKAQLLISIVQLLLASVGGSVELLYHHELFRGRASVIRQTVSSSHVRIRSRAIVSWLESLCLHFSISRTPGSPVIILSQQ